MKAVLLVALVALPACAAAPEAPPAPPAGPPGIVVPLKNAGFEDNPPASYRCAPGWSCTMHASPESFKFLVDDSTAAGGKRSFRVEPAAHREPWALVMQVLPDIASLRGARVRYSLAVRMENVQGKGAGAIAIAQWPSGADMNNWRSQEAGTTGWKRLQVEFVVPKDAGLLEVGAVLEGSGRFWIDDAKLEILAPAGAK